MTMPTPPSSPSDSELLRAYCRSNSDSEAAFAELVRRHLDAVYSSASRRLRGDAAGAADLTQMVFSELARKAGSLVQHPALIAWLFTTTRQMAHRKLRDEVRRRRRELEASAQKAATHETSDPDWCQVSPILDSALDALSEADRRILLLRHLDRQPFGSIGTQLGLRENTARMRGERALEKLRRLLSQRGVTSTAAALAFALEGPAVTAAPPGLTASIPFAASSAASAHLGFLSFMATTSAKTTAITLTFAGLGTALFLQIREARDLRLNNAALSLQIASEQDELNSMRARLANTNSRAVLVPGTQAEVLRLRGQVAHLLREKRITPTTDRTAGSKLHRSTDWNPLDDLTDRGTTTPQDASVSFLTSLRTQNQQRFNELVQLPDDLDPQARSKQLATLFQLFCNRYATWEFTGMTQERVEGISTGNGGTEAGAVDLDYVDSASGQSGAIRVHLRKSGTDWRVAIDDFPRESAPETSGR